MTRLRGPAPDSWSFLLVGGLFRSAGGLTGVAYAGLTGSTLADIRVDDGTNTPGAPIPGSAVTIDSTTSAPPQFWYPDGDVSVVYMSVNGGPRTPVYANYNTRIDGKVDKGDLVVNAKDYGAKGDDSTDDTAALQSAANAAAVAGAALVLHGTHKISGTIDLPAGITVDGLGGGVRQTVGLTPALRVNNATGVTIRNVRITGLTSDYLNTSAVYNAAGIQLSGTTSNVRIEGCTITGTAGAGVYIPTTGISQISIRNNTITGPGSGYILNNTYNYSGGVVLIDDVDDIDITGNRISQYAQGIVTGVVTNLRVTGNHIHNIVGQHGMYIDSPANAVVAGNIVRNTGLQGIKLQLANASPPDGTQVTVTGNVLTGIGSHCILLTDVSTSGSPHLRRIVITDNTCEGTGSGGDGINIQDTIGAIVTGNVTYNTIVGINVNASSRLTITDNRISTCTKTGVFITASDDVIVRGNRIIDPASANDATSEFGIYATGLTTSNLVVDDNIVSDSAGNMKYGLYLAAMDQATAVVRGNTLTGATDYGARLDSTKSIKEWAGNNCSGTLGETLSFPTTFVVRGAPLEFTATAAPTSGTWRRGDLVWNSQPTPTSSMGWVCTAAGTPGTWRAFGGPAAGSAYAGPAANGLIGAPYDPIFANTGMGAVTTGVLYLTKVDLPNGGPISAVRVFVTGAGTGLTAGQNLIGVYDSGGAFVVGSVDQTTNWGSTGVKEATLTAATSAYPAGAQVYAAILANGTTGPQLRGFTATASFNNDNLSATAYRWATAGTGLTALPGTLPAMSASTLTTWCGLK